MAFEIEYFCTSHIGNRRSANQDNFLCVGKFMDSDNTGTNGIISGKTVNPKPAFFGVFDGMGGEECGEIASYIAAKTASTFEFGKKIDKDFVRYCKEANKAICDYTSEHDITSMGTTLASLLFRKNRIYLCNIGDSKIFRFSKNKIEQISYDHVASAAYGTKAPLTQNLGIPETELIIAPYIASGYFNGGDKYLICSDGLTDMVSLDDIAETLRTKEGSEAAETLLQQALVGGGRDNITIILLSLKETRKKIFGIF